MPYNARVLSTATAKAAGEISRLDITKQTLFEHTMLVHYCTQYT